MYQVWGRSGNGFDWHAPAKTVITKERPLEKFFKFAFVRNPWDRMWSFYHHVALAHPETYDMDFNDWLTSYNDSEDRQVGQTAEWDEPMSSTRRPQMYWITDDSGNIILDFVGRFEKIEQDFEYVAEKIKLYEWCDNPILQHVRKKENEQHYTEVYNEKGRNHVARYFASDILTFGYRFGR